ncbi:MAG: MFS transporter [Polynucleobacter sp.]|jgi:MFS family permease|nr:MFS transporter [Polynucleobacter sp.]
MENLKSIDWRTPTMVLWVGGIILAISFGVRHTFGIFLQPMSLDNNWGREVFALSLAVQNIVWGIAQPFAGRIADRRGAGWVIVLGTLVYAAGLYLMSSAQTSIALIWSAGILIGIGLAGTTAPVVFGVISRSVPVEKRSMALGLSMSIGSFGQFAMLPATMQLINYFNWSTTLYILTAITVIMIPLAFFMMEKPQPKDDPNSPKPLALAEILKQAMGHHGFRLLTIGFFVCGFHIAFLATHLPAYLSDQGLNPSVGTNVLALIGLFNIAGSYYFGLWGGKFPKPHLLSLIYTGRALAIAAFIFLPISAVSAYIFAAVIGVLWLSTVPLTNGIVGSIFGVKNMSMLGGIVFFSHQIGAFLGVWLGGKLFDLFGSYDIVWAISIVISLMAAVINFPIKESAYQARPVSA